MYKLDESILVGGGMRYFTPPSPPCACPRASSTSRFYLRIHSYSWSVVLRRGMLDATVTLPLLPPDFTTRIDRKILYTWYPENRWTGGIERTFLYNGLMQPFSLRSRFFVFYSSIFNFFLAVSSYRLLCFRCRCFLVSFMLSNVFLSRRKKQ